MPFQQLECLIQSPHTTLLIEYLENHGALSITLLDAKDNPIYEPEPDTTPYWQEMKLQALFDEHHDMNKLIHEIKKNFSISSKINFIHDEPWERACMDQFTPMRFGEKLWICPSWHEIDDKNATIISLDPGLAFGTGNHPTTHLCLEWIATHDVNDFSVIDYGCGSGILAIACIKSGAKIVYATDIDPQALTATTENKTRNQLSSKQIITLMPDELPKLQVDLIIANILANPIISLAPRFSSLLKQNGKIVLSGILKEQIDQVCETYKNAFEILEIHTREEWGLIYCRKQSA